MADSVLDQLRADYHSALCEKTLVIAETKKHGPAPSNADSSNGPSCAVANGIARRLEITEGERGVAQTSGNSFESITAAFVRSAFEKLQHLRPGSWTVQQVSSRSRLGIARFSQYAHLSEIHNLIKANRELSAILGRDYSVASDIVVYRDRLSDDALNEFEHIVGDAPGRDDLRLASGVLPNLHASISCKWTIRSDRAQNSRTEALDLMRKRKGRCPHIVVVTGEPLPSRIASIALGTGDLDCTYHFALPELIQAVGELGQSEAIDILGMMVEGKRLKDIADLPLDLAV
jgi:hypothetical protein